MAVFAPTTPPNVIRALPLLIVRACAPLMVELEPLKVIAASVEARLIAPVDKVIGPV